MVTNDAQMYYQKVIDLYSVLSSPLCTLSPDMTVTWMNQKAGECFTNLQVGKGIEFLLSHDSIQKLCEKLLNNENVSAEILRLPFSQNVINFEPVINEEDHSLAFVIVYLPNYTSNSSALDPQSNERIVFALCNQFRSPLTVAFSMLGPIANFLRRQPGGEPILEYVEVISQNLYKMLRHTVNLTELTRFMSGNASLTYKDCDIADLIRNLCLASGSALSNPSIILDFDLPDEPVVTRVDVEKFTLAFLNLILNACQNRKEGLRVHVVLTTTDSFAKITVSDNGNGIPADVLPQVFNPYFSYDPDLPLSPNAGLGLTIVKNIACEHGGAVYIQSLPGQGTSVSFTVKLLEPSDEPILCSSVSDYLRDRFSPIYIALAEVCDSPFI